METKSSPLSLASKFLNVKQQACCRPVAPTGAMPFVESAPPQGTPSPLQEAVVFKGSFEHAN